MEYTKFMADRVKTMKGSAIREMFKRMADPEIISLAGGNPASELFPGDELSKIAGKILMTNPTLALQVRYNRRLSENERLCKKTCGKS